MDMENQATIKRLAEENGTDSVVVMLGATDLQGAEIAATTVTLGDPSFSGPLAGASLRLPVYHILEPEVKKAIPEDVYAEQAGFMEMVVDTARLGSKFKEFREGIDNQ
jgi:betaine reductase